MNRDFEDLFRSLTIHEVEFLVVGSTLLAFYARPRYTEDVALWIRKSRDNVDRLASALEEFGLIVNREAVRALADKPDQMVVLGAAPQAVDILNEVTGLEFEAAWKNRREGPLFGVKVQFLSREDFIQSKRAAGRSKDLADLALLEEVERDGS